MSRTALASLCALCAGVIIWAGVTIGVDTPYGAVLINAGTEIGGIAVTVAIVDWLSERRALRASSKRLASEHLTQIQYAVWVWQGGSHRGGSTASLLELLEHVGKYDQVPASTQALFLEIGDHAYSVLTRSWGELAVNQDLRTALAILVQLQEIRDAPHLVPKRIAKVLSEGIQLLEVAAGYPVESPAPHHVPRYRDPSIASQRWRHFGEVATGEYSPTPVGETWWQPPEGASVLETEVDLGTARDHRRMIRNRGKAFHDGYCLFIVWREVNSERKVLEVGHGTLSDKIVSLQRDPGLLWDCFITWASVEKRDGPPAALHLSHLLLGRNADDHLADTLPVPLPWWAS